MFCLGTVPNCPFFVLPYSLIFLSQLMCENHPIPQILSISRRKGTPSFDIEHHVDVAQSQNGSLALDSSHDVDQKDVHVAAPEHIKKAQPDAFFLQKGFVSEPVDSEVETYLNDGARRALEALVNEQRKIAVDTQLTRVSPSLSASQEMAKEYLDGKSPKGHVKSLQGPRQKAIPGGVGSNNSAKFTGGFYISKLHGTTGVMAPFPIKTGGGRYAASDSKLDAEGEVESTASDDNDSRSTVGVTAPEFASIDSTSNIPARRRNSDDATSEGSYASDRTFVEPYLTSAPSVGHEAHATQKVIDSSASFASLANEDTGADVDCAEPAVDAVGEPTNPTSKLFSTITPEVGKSSSIDATPYPDVESVEEEDTNVAVNSSGSSPTASAKDDLRKFVTLHDDLNLLSDESLLSLSELRSKIDEVDRIRSKREGTKSPKLQLRATNPQVVRPAAPLAKRWGSSSLHPHRTGHHKGIRTAYEEPPAYRMHGSQLQHNKMFQSNMMVGGMEALDVKTATTNMAASTVSQAPSFSTSPGRPMTFTGIGNRPNSRGAVDSNATMKDAITAIIRTNVTRGGAKEFGDHLSSAAVRGLRTAVRKTVTPAYVGHGISPLDAALTEARAMGAPLLISPRTAFDDCSVSSTDSYISYSSQYSSEAGYSMGSPRTAIRKSALTIAMAEVEADAFQTTAARKQDLKGKAEQQLPVLKKQEIGNETREVHLGEDGKQTEAVDALKCDKQNNEENDDLALELDSDDIDDIDNIDDKLVDAAPASAGLCGRSTPIPIAVAVRPRLSISEPAEADTATPDRQQAGSAPAQISVERVQARSRVRQSADDDEEELMGLF